MSVKLIRMSYLLPALALSGLVLAPACGDDDDDNPVVDARPEIDAAVPPDAPSVDAPPAGPTRAGTIAITELAQSEDTTVGGSHVTIQFEDLATATVAPAYGTSPVGDCVVYTYDLATQAPPTAVPEGTVAVGGTAHDGFNCPGLDDGTYGCAEIAGVAGMGTAAVDDGLVDAGATVSYTIEGADLTGTNPVGAAAVFLGFDADHSAAATPGLVTEVTVPNQVTTQNLKDFDSGLADGDPATMAADGNFAFFVGFFPPAFPGYANVFNFLDDGTEDVTISMPATANVGAIDVTLKAAGEGFALNATSAQPHALPTTSPAADVVFSCAGADETSDTCGVRAADSGIDTLVINGTADNAADDAEPTKIATFQCAYLGSVTEATIPAAAMDAILSIEPTSITTTVIHAAGSIVTDDAGNVTNVLVGHGVVGVTTVGGGTARVTQPSYSPAVMRALAAKR